MGQVHSVSSEQRMEIFKYLQRESDIGKVLDAKEVPEIDEDAKVRKEVRRMRGQKEPTSKWEDWHIADHITIESMPLLVRMADGLTEDQVRALFKMFLDEENWERKSWDLHFEPDGLWDGNEDDDFEWALPAIDIMLNEYITLDNFYGWLHGENARFNIEVVGLIFADRFPIIRYELIANLTLLINRKITQEEHNELAADRDIEFPYVRYQWVEADNKISEVMECADIPPFGYHAYLGPRTFRWGCDTQRFFYNLSTKLQIQATTKAIFQEYIETDPPQTSDEVEPPVLSFKPVANEEDYFCRTFDLFFPDWNHWWDARECGAYGRFLITGDPAVYRYSMMGPDTIDQVIRMEVHGLPVKEGIKTDDIRVAMEKVRAFLRRYINVIEAFAEYARRSPEWCSEELADAKLWTGKLVFAVTPIENSAAELFKVEDWEAFCSNDMPGFVPFEGTNYPLFYPGRARHCPLCKGLDFDAHLIDRCPFGNIPSN